MRFFIAILALPLLTNCLSLDTFPNQRIYPVNVTVYYESRCPDSRHYFHNEVYPTWQKLQDSGILNLKLIPYGKCNATRVGKHYKFDCQHGPEECWQNVMESLALTLIPKPVSMAFVDCISQLKKKPGNAKAEAENCAKKHMIPAKMLEVMVRRWYGLFQMENFILTGDVVKKTNYVPTTSIDGKIYKKLKNLLKLVCTAYKGPKKPAACSKA